MVKISVITCTYKKDDFLRVCLESLKSQKYTDWECLVLDDANQKSTKSLVESFCDQRFVYVPNVKTLGIAENHIKGLELTRGEYISILNQDDILLPDFLSRLIGLLMENPSCCLAFCDHYIVNEAGIIDNNLTEKLSSVFKRKNLSPGVYEKWGQLVLGLSIPMAVGVVFKKENLPKDWDCFLKKAGPAYDFFLSTLLWSGGNPCIYLPARLSKYRIHSKSESAKANPSWFIGAYECCNYFLQYSLDKFEIRLAKEISAKFLYMAARASYKKNTPDYKVLARKALRAKVSLKTLTHLFISHLL
jgi:glycosyltransferase involved in cell wall biosynthesis